MKFKFAILSLIALITACGNSAKPGAEISIAFSPDSLKFEQEGGTLSFFVTSEQPGFSLLTDADWITSIEPPYEAQASGTFTVKAKPNPNPKERMANLTIKCGQTRAYIPVVQAGLDVDAAGIDVPDGYTLVWHDEFDYEGLPESSSWKYQTGDGGWGNHELQDYVAGEYKGTHIADVCDGTLKIYAKKIDGKVRSARMNTRKSWTYGYIESSMKLPVGKGTWPAFWMMPQNFTGWPKDGEIDIMEEVGYHANYCSSTVHCIAYNNGGTPTEHAERFISTAQTAFHIYGLEWTPEYMTFYQDRKAILTYRNNGKGYSYWPFDNPFYIIFNLAWGGDWGGAMGIDETCLPAVFEVDWVRVFQKL